MGGTSAWQGRGRARSVLRSLGAGGGLRVQRVAFCGRGGRSGWGTGTWRGGGAAAGKVLLLGKSGDSSSASSGLARQGRALRVGGEYAPTGDRRTGSSCSSGGLGAPSSRRRAPGHPARGARSRDPAGPAPPPSNRGRPLAENRKTRGPESRRGPAAGGIGGARHRGEGGQRDAQPGKKEREKEGAES